MNQLFEHYSMLADLFDYPGKNYSERILKLGKFLKLNYPEAGSQLQPFVSYMSEADILEQQELFIRSFDVQAVTTLDLGYVMFGDDYKRGELLVNLNREHREVQNDCGTELADYLPNLLRLLPKLRDTQLREELVHKIITPAIGRMIKGFEPDQIVLKDKFYKKKHKTIIDRPDEHYTIYQRALKTLHIVLANDFGRTESEPEKKTSDFLKNIVKEVKLEG